MKIVLYYGYLANPGGAERILLEEYKFLKRKRIETKILTFKVNKEALYDYTAPDLEIMGNTRFSYEKNSLRNFVHRVIALRKRLKELEPDLVKSFTGSEIYLATLFTKIPYVMYIPGTIFWFNEGLLKYALIHKRKFNEIRDSVIGHREFISPKPDLSFRLRIKIEFAALLDYLAVRKAKRIFVHSPQMGWEIKKIYGKDSMILRGGISSSLLNYQSKQDIKKILGLEKMMIILSVSRLDARKRVDVLIRAFEKLTAKFDDLALVIVGIGPEEGRLKALTRKLALQDKVFFTGYVRDADLWDYYAICDVFATPAWADFDITPYEAMAVQKKVVWSSEMTSDLLKDERVIVAEPTIQAFAEGIERALNLKIEKTIDLRDYTWESYFTRLLKVYKDIISS